MPGRAGRRGALPFAFVVLKSGATLDEDAVKRHAIAHGPAFAHPRYVAFVPEIPLAATNKPDRKVLTESAAALAKARPRNAVA